MKRSSSKILSVLVALVLVLAMVAGCGPAATTRPSGTTTNTATPSSTTQGQTTETTSKFEQGSLESYFEKIEPLSKQVKLRIGIGAGILHDFPTYAALSLGGMEMVGIDAELVYFGNGPLMVEAIAANSIDAGGYGVGGVLAGSVQGVAEFVHFRMDEAVVQKYFAKKDSEIVKSGINPKTGFYGTAEAWKGKETYLPPGTTLQYLLGVALDKLELTPEDIKQVFMDAKNVNTAVYAGQGEVWGLWNLFGYAKTIQDDYVELFNGADLGVNFLAASVARKSALADPDLKAAIGKWVELQNAVVEWMQANPDNMTKAVDIFYQWTQEEGVMAEKEDLVLYMNDVQFYTLDENYKLFTDKTADGVLLAKSMTLTPMDYFISRGNYTEADKAKITDDRFNVSFIKEIMDGKK